jgi:hypothetical protein
LDCIDALRSVTKNAASFLASEVHIERGLHIKEEQRVDITTRLRPVETGTGHFSSSVWAFDIMTWTEQTDWTAHCHGRIEANFEEGNLGVPESAARKDAEVLLANGLNPTRDHALAGYNMLQKSGLGYGLAFQNMVSLWTELGRAA